MNVSLASFSAQSGERLLAYSEFVDGELTFNGVLPTGCFLVELYVAALPTAGNGPVRLLWNEQVNVTQGLGTNSSDVGCLLQAQTSALLSVSALSQQTALQTVCTISTVASVATTSTASTATCRQPGQVDTINGTVSGTLLTLLASTITSTAVANMSQAEAFAVLVVAGGVLQQLTATYIPTGDNFTSTLSPAGVFSQSIVAGGTGMEQVAFDSATAVVQVLISVLASNVLNGTTDVITSVSSQLASSLGSMVQTSQSLLASGDDNTTDVACSRFATSVSQVQDLLNVQNQQTAADSDASDSDSVATSSSFITSGFLASTWQIIAGPTSGNVSTALSGGLPMSVPTDALSAIVGVDTDMSVRVVQVSGAWAMCNTASYAATTTNSVAGSLVAAAQIGAVVVSSNIVTIDITALDGSAYHVVNLTQPIKFQLVAPSLSIDTTTDTVPTCSWYDETTYSWSTIGCDTTLLSNADNTTTVLCSCSHLTDFGVIYADAKDTAAFEAVVNGFGGYMVLLVWYILTCIVSGYQLSRLLQLSAIKEKLLSRVISAIGKGSTQTTAYHSEASSLSPTNSSGSSLVLIEHLLVFLISLCRGVSMCIYYTFDDSVSFTAVSALSILPLVGNMWVYSFVIFQWSAIYYNAARGGGVGEADFSSNSIQRLRAVFYASMSSVTIVVCCLLLAINQSHSSAQQQHLAFVGILVTLVVVGAMSALLFSVGLMLVYSLTRDFTSRHATKLFLLALTFSCTLLGQSLVLVHQAVTAGNIYTEFNKDAMMYYGLDAVGHVLVLAMFARSVQAATAQGKKHTSQASTTEASLKVASSLHSSQQSLDKKARKVIDLGHPNRPSFHQHSDSVSDRHKQLASPSSKSGHTVSQIQMATWERSTNSGRVLPPLFTSSTLYSRNLSYSSNATPWSPTALTQPVLRLSTLTDDERGDSGPAAPMGPGSPSIFSPASLSPVATDATAASTPSRFTRVLPPLITSTSPSHGRQGTWSPFRPLLSKTSRVAPLSPVSDHARANSVQMAACHGPLSPVSVHHSSRSWMEPGAHP